MRWRFVRTCQYRTSGSSHPSAHRGAGHTDARAYCNRRPDQYAGSGCAHQHARSDCYAIPYGHNRAYRGAGADSHACAYRSAHAGTHAGTNFCAYTHAGADCYAGTHGHPVTYPNA